MIYGLLPTRSLCDKAYAPPESQPIAAAIALDDRFFGADGRKLLRKLLGPEHEVSNQDIPGMRGFPVWRFVLDGIRIEAAPETHSEADSLPTVYLLGPTAKKFLNVEGPKTTSGADAAIILSHIASKLGVQPRT